MTVNPRQSFKLKLCMSILCSSLLVFLLIFAAAFYYTSKEIKDSVANIVTSKLALATTGLEDRLSALEIATDNLLCIVRSPLVEFDRKSIDIIGKDFLDANPYVQGANVGYEDGSKYGHPGPWCPYVMKRDGEYTVRDLSTVYDYRNAEWYRTPLDTHAKSLSQPFTEANGTLVVTFAIPVYNVETGDPECVVALDHSLNDLSDMLQEYLPYEGSHLYVVARDGRYIAHPDHECVLKDTVSAELRNFIASGDEYYCDKKKGRADVYYFSSKVTKSDWTVLLSVPQRAMVERPVRMMNIMIIVMILGIVLLLLGSLFVIDRLTKPLEKFSEAARQISHGNFDVDLPVIEDHNELYDLRAALASMRVSLDRYVHKLEETSSKKASMERELDIARKIQMSMVPKVFPPYPERDNLDMFASLTPAQAVGGDLYDFILCGDKFFFCIGDVSGKGVPASLFMAITRTLFRNSAATDKTPSQIARIINDAMSEGNDEGMFVTMVIASFDLVSGELKICNCGHNLPVTNGNIVDPSTMKATPDAPFHLINGLPTNIAVGVMPGFQYNDVTMHIAPGCMLLLYTDGVTEAENKSKELYGEDRLLALLEKLGKDCTSTDAVKAITDDVKSFTSGAEQSDDITLLCLRCSHLG